MSSSFSQVFVTVQTNVSENWKNSSSVSKSANESRFPNEMDGNTLHIYIILFTIVTVPSFLATLYYLTLICARRKFRRATNYLTANLLFSSLIFMVLVSIRITEKNITLWSYESTHACQITAILQRIPMHVIPLTTMNISMERCRAAGNPLHHHHPSRIKTLSILSFSWVVATLLSLPLWWTRDYDPDELKSYKCKRVLLINKKVYNISYGALSLIVGYILPAIALINELYKLRGQLQFTETSKCRVSSSKEIITLSKREQLLRTSFVFSCLFLVCWLPIGVFQVILDQPQEVLPKHLEKKVRVCWLIVRSVAYAVVMAHPILLTYLTYEMKVCWSRIKI